ncbi:MAG: D-glycero-beta-D-manno-heptose 1-phosphate adenylyltransferase [Candidatus Mcinerneyibacterium aminivorans]|uniref:D-glycero-beta-D-manno-heptose 1-phosphate adenylyltransferase n=1 Tax=Candidatus Mcinerneyibacterium aminivorans TaxID=2703815 RepID=A0A5D0MI81_9BACT|nr:MAG: D-glycero-beta-D-manno-heptose 1-phosphate adenylyltransferase [Candidatus Mcinerneyibacterium aminivorans]
MKNLISKKSAEKYFENLKKENIKLVFTNGCFDILHVGHVRYLKEAKKLGDRLVVGLNSDTSVKKIKGKKRPIINERERAEILLSLSCVDFVVIFEEETPYRLIKKVKPDILVKGGDWEIEDIVGSKFVQSYGGVVKSISYIEGKSTTGIIERIEERYGD